MSTDHTTTRWLLADVGGTHTRCALTDAQGRIDGVSVVDNDASDSLEALLRDYLDRARDSVTVPAAAIGVAAPITGDVVTMLNRNWRFSCDALRRALDLDTLEVINDFTAQALALPHLDPASELRKLGGGEGAPGEALAVIGPGTGLGVSGLIPHGGTWAPIAGEGGHVTLAATNDLEAALVDAMRQRFGHCSAERLLCGPGLALLHEALTGLDGSAQVLPSREVSARALAGDEAALRTLDQFFSWLGAVAGDLALTLG
ncbi:MAG: ROK family protein, partial [Pseudomonadota bacterium]